MYHTTCPKCGAEQLTVVSGSFYAAGMMLHEDGFATMDANEFSTEDEKVECGACGATCDLGDLDADLDEPVQTDGGSHGAPDSTGSDSPAGVSEPYVSEGRDLVARLQASEGVCRIARRLVESKHHVATSPDGYGHSEVDWVIFYDLAEALRRWKGACADAERKDPAYL